MSRRTRRATGCGGPVEPQVREDQESYRSERTSMYLYLLHIAEPCTYELRAVVIIFRRPGYDKISQQLSMD